MSDIHPDEQLRERITEIAFTTATVSKPLVDQMFKLIKDRDTQHERELVEARIDELSKVNTRRHYGKGYRDSLDILDDYKYKRIAELMQRHMQLINFPDNEERDNA